MIVYRVEHVNDRCGPHVGTMPDAPWSKVSQRKPRATFSLPYGLWYGWRFGFSSIQQMTRYFSANELKELKRIGFVLAIYEASEFRFDESQAAFEADSAMHKVDVDLLTFSSSTVMIPI